MSSATGNRDSNQASMQGLLQQLDSARADCQFLASSHAETLRGLHDEISSLQRSNRQLQFQLTFESDSDDRVKQLETTIDQLHLANTKCQSQLDEQRRKSETKLTKARAQSDQLHQRIRQLEDELKRTIGSYQSLVISLEKQNEQQATRLAAATRENTISIRRLAPPSSKTPTPITNQSQGDQQQQSRPTTPRRLPPLRKPL